MIRGGSILRAVTWLLVAVSVGLLAGSPVSAASEAETFINLTNALQRLAEPSSRRSLPPPPSEASTHETVTHDFTLLGVVIAGNTRLALIQRTAGQELLPIGQTLAGYRLVDVEENQVTFEGQRGERLVLRMPTDGGAVGPAVPR